MRKICVYGTLREGQSNYSLLKEGERVGSTKLIISTEERTLKPVTYPLTHDVCGAEVYEISEKDYHAIDIFEQGYGYVPITTKVIDDITLEVHEVTLWGLK